MEITLEISPSDRAEPCALAAHFPPNLTTLSLQYMADGWQSFCEPPDDYQVCQRRYGAWALVTMAANHCSCVHMFVTCSTKKLYGL